MSRWVWETSAADSHATEIDNEQATGEQMETSDSTEKSMTGCVSDSSVGNGGKRGTFHYSDVISKSDSEKMQALHASCYRHPIARTKE